VCVCLYVYVCVFSIKECVCVQYILTVKKKTEKKFTMPGMLGSDLLEQIFTYYTYGSLCLYWPLFVGLFVCDVHPSSREDSDWHARVGSACTCVEISHI